MIVLNISQNAVLCCSQINKRCKNGWCLVLFYRSWPIAVDSRNNFTVYHMNEMNVFDQLEQECYLYLQPMVNL